MVPGFAKFKSHENYSLYGRFKIINSHLHSLHAVVFQHLGQEMLLRIKQVYLLAFTYEHAGTIHMKLLTLL